MIYYEDHQWTSIQNMIVLTPIENPLLVRSHFYCHIVFISALLPQLLLLIPGYLKVVPIIIWNLNHYSGCWVPMIGQLQLHISLPISAVFGCSALNDLFYDQIKSVPCLNLHIFIFWSMVYWVFSHKLQRSIRRILFESPNCPLRKR